jgi:hypothetical protein
MTNNYYIQIKQFYNSLMSVTSCRIKLLAKLIFRLTKRIFRVHDKTLTIHEDDCQLLLVSKTVIQISK